MLCGDGVPTEFRGTTFPLGPATSFGPLLERRRPSLTTGQWQPLSMIQESMAMPVICVHHSPKVSVASKICASVAPTKTLLSVQIPIHPLLPRHNYHKLAFQTKLRKEYGSKLTNILGWSWMIKTKTKHDQPIVGPCILTHIQWYGALPSEFVNSSHQFD